MARLSAALVRRRRRLLAGGGGGGGAAPSAPLLTLDSVAADIPQWIVDWVDPQIGDTAQLQRSTDNFSTSETFDGDTAILSLSPVTHIGFTASAWPTGDWTVRVRLIRSGVNGDWSNEASVTITAAADQFYSGVHLTGGAQFYDGIHAGA